MWGLGAVLIGLALGVGLQQWLARRVAGDARALGERVLRGRTVGRGDPPAILRMRAEGNGAGGTWRAVRLTQEAEMRLGPDKPWAAITAEQVIGLGQPGFVWTARQGRGPIPKIVVVDAYAGGRGRLRAALLGAVTVADASGPEMDRAEAMRYLAELPWAPDAVLGNPDIRWRDGPDGSIEAGLAVGGSVAWVRFHLDAVGDIVAVEADRPERTQDGTVILRPWRGEFREYGEIGGRRMPLSAEVGYIYDDGYHAYWRGRITGYELVR